MKSFSQFVEESNKAPQPVDTSWKNSSLSFKSSFSELRDLWKESPLSFSGSFAELRSKKKPTVDESMNVLSEAPKKSWVFDHPEEGSKPIQNSRGAVYNSAFHDHPDIAPKELSADHIEALKHYCSMSGVSSSGNINALLRNKEGDKSQSIIGGHTPENVLESVKRLSSVFTPNNTNRKQVKVWGGIPSYIGHKLTESGEGSQHYLPGFTSASSSKHVAADFADEYNSKLSKDHPDKNKLLHLCEYSVHPGSAVSPAAHSPFGENEVIIKHGSKVTYRGSKDIKIPHPSNPNKKITARVHSVTVHSEHKPLEEYGHYS